MCEGRKFQRNRVRYGEVRRGYRRYTARQLMDRVTLKESQEARRTSGPHPPEVTNDTPLYHG